MTVTMKVPEGDIRKYYGTAAELAAFTDTPPTGAEFYSTDELVTYVYTGSAWVEKKIGSSGDATEAKQDTIISTIGTPADTDIATDIANVQTGVDAIPTTMRGTDNAALASAVTVPEADVTTNVNERDVIGNKADAAVITDVADKSIAGKVRGILSLLIHGTYGLSAIKTLIDAIKAVTDVALDSSDVQTACEAAIAAEGLFYNPGLQDTADLEASTKTITNTSENSTPDYTKALTLAMPDDARIAVENVIAQLNTTIDSFNTATILYCRVYVGTDNDADHMIIDATVSTAGSTGAKVNKGKATAHTLAYLADGLEHTWYFHFWVNQATNAVISLVRLYCGVGYAPEADYNNDDIITIDHTGMISCTCKTRKIGSDDVSVYYIANSANTSGDAGDDGRGDGYHISDYAFLRTASPVCYEPRILMRSDGTSYNTIVVIDYISLVLRK